MSEKQFTQELFDKYEKAVADIIQRNILLASISAVIGSGNLSDREKVKEVMLILKKELERRKEEIKK